MGRTLRADILSPGDFEGPVREQRRWAIIFRLAALCVVRSVRQVA
jgi:hypothetical protein